MSAQGNEGVIVNNNTTIILNKFNIACYLGVSPGKAV